MAVSLFRQLSLATAIVFLTSNSTYQLVIGLYGSNLCCQFYWKVKPMVDGTNNFVQVFNEGSILVVFCLSFAFTEGVPDPVARFKYGWFFLYSIYMNLAVNFSIIISVILSLSYAYLKQRYSWYLFG